MALVRPGSSVTNVTGCGWSVITPTFGGPSDTGWDGFSKQPASVSSRPRPVIIDRRSIPNGTNGATRMHVPPSRVFARHATSDDRATGSLLDPRRGGHHADVWGILRDYAGPGR